MSIGVNSATRVMRVKSTLAALALDMALIWVKMAVENCIKVVNTLRYLKDSCKSRWVFK